MAWGLESRPVWSRSAAARRSPPVTRPKARRCYRKCKACHAADEEKISWGPHLVGIVGRPAASVEGFRGYSQAMKDSGIVWDEATLDKYLTDPRAMMPKTNMPFPGVNKEDDRRDVIAYLKTLQR